jgi:glutathione peroxidase
MRLDLVAVFGMFAMNANALDCASTDIDASQRRLLGASENICDVYGGKVLLVTNVASHCGFTNQYEGLEKLYKENKEKGLVVLGFPSGDFKDQEFESEAQIAEFCKMNFGVTFPMFSKSSVKGDQANPLFKKLITKTGEEPGWNFNKYLIGRDGKVIAHFGSKVEPDSPQLTQAIQAALK